MKTKNGHILTVSHKMQICAVSCFATCDWFFPMTSQILFDLLRSVLTCEQAHHFDGNKPGDILGDLFPGVTSEPVKTK